MGRFPRTITLEEAFRRILRAKYPDRPALADEIKVWSGFNANDPDELKAVEEAKRKLAELVAGEKIRLRGVLHPSSRLEDIDPAHARAGLLDIFAGELRISQTNLGKHKAVQIYRQVHCYETDVDRCVAELHPEPKSNGPKRSSDADFAQFIEANLDGGTRPSEEKFIAAGKAAGINRPREDFRNALRNAFGPARPGRPNNSPGNSPK